MSDVLDEKERGASEGQDADAVTSRSPGAEAQSQDDQRGSKPESLSSALSQGQGELSPGISAEVAEDDDASPSSSPSASVSSTSDDLFDAGSTGSPSSVKIFVKKGIAENIIELRRKAKAQIQNEEFSQALSLLNECIALCPGSANLFRLRCLCFSRLGVHDKALEDAHVIEKLKPKSCTSYFHLGSSYYGVGDYSAAAKAFQQGLLINPQDRALLEGFRNALTMITNLRNQQRGDGTGSPAPRQAAEVQTTT